MSKSRSFVILRVVACAVLVGQAGAAQRADRVYSAFSQDKHRQFDFWIGEWDVNLRMLDDNFVFQDRVRAKASVYSILKGKAILELWDSQPIKGYSLRYYDPNADEWVLWLNWPNNNQSATSSLRGGFRHGRGEFRSEYQDVSGNTVIQRYAFTDITPFSLRWDDLASRDGGKTWRKNWRMEFTRTADEPSWPEDSHHLPTYDTGFRCDAEPFRAYDGLVGRWEGAVDEAPASLTAYRALDGCAVLAFLTIEGRPRSERFFMLTFDTRRRQWEISFLDDRRDTGLARFHASEDWARSSDGVRELRWELAGDELSYRLTAGGEKGESGAFTRE